MISPAMPTVSLMLQSENFENYNVTILMTLSLQTNIVFSIAYYAA